jgi:hypothetical protein
MPATVASIFAFIDPNTPDVLKKYVASNVKKSHAQARGYILKARLIKNDFVWLTY